MPRMALPHIFYSFKRQNTSLQKDYFAAVQLKSLLQEVSSTGSLAEYRLLAECA